MLQHRPVSLFLDVLEVLGGAAVGRIALAHVADAACELGQPLPARSVALPLYRHVTRFQEFRPGDEGDAGLAEDFHGVYVNGCLGVAHPALRSMSRRRAAMSSGIVAASLPTLSCVSGSQSVAGILTPGLRIVSGS